VKSTNNAVTAAIGFVIIVAICAAIFFLSATLTRPDGPLGSGGQVTAGMRLSDVVLSRLDGTWQPLSQVIGPYDCAFIRFLSPNCPTCHEEVAAISETQDLLREHNVCALTIWSGDTARVKDIAQIVAGLDTGRSGPCRVLRDRDFSVIRQAWGVPPGAHYLILGPQLQVLDIGVEREGEPAEVLEPLWRYLESVGR